MVYWAIIKKDDLGNNSELLSNNVAFIGYDIKVPGDPFLSRRYAFIKAHALEADPLITNNGKFPVQVLLLVEGLMGSTISKEFIIYDSRGISEKIVTNRRFERDLLEDSVLFSKDGEFWKDKKNGEQIDPELLLTPTEDQRHFSVTNMEEFIQVTSTIDDKTYGITRLYDTRDIQ